jgi:hypothetical protein
VPVQLRPAEADRDHLGVSEVRQRYVRRADHRHSPGPLRGIDLVGFGQSIAKAALLNDDDLTGQTE